MPLSLLWRRRIISCKGISQQAASESYNAIPAEGFNAFFATSSTTRFDTAANCSLAACHRAAAQRSPSSSPARSAAASTAQRLTTHEAPSSPARCCASTKNNLVSEEEALPLRLRSAWLHTKLPRARRAAVRAPK